MFSVLHCLMALLQTDDDQGPPLKRLDDGQEQVEPQIVLLTTSLVDELALVEGVSSRLVATACDPTLYLSSLATAS